MQMFAKIALFGVAGLLLAALPAAAQPTTHKAKPKATPAVEQYAIIWNSGSTNTTGYTVELSMLSNHGFWKPSTYEDMPRSAVPKNQMPLVAKLFHDLNAAVPLTSLPAGHGARSASFGTQTTIFYEHQESPDLTFTSDPRTVALKADIAALTNALGVKNMPRPVGINDKPE